MSTLVIVRGMPYSGKTRWTMRQLELLSPHYPVRMFEPQHYPSWQSPVARGHQIARNQCLHETHQALAEDRKTICFVTDIFPTENDIKPYMSCHAKIKILVELMCPSLKKTCSDKVIVRLTSIWDAPENLSFFDKFSSIHEIDNVEQTIDSSHLSYKPLVVLEP